LFFDLTVLPWTLAWQVPFTGFIKFSAFFSIAFWTLDVLVTFSKGFYFKGDLVVDARKIVRHYMRTWFVPDLLMVMCDWAGVSVELLVGGGGAQSLKMLRCVRLGRMLRIVGIVRMLRIFQGHQDLMHEVVSDEVRLGLWVVLLALLALLWTHLIACAWWAVGNFGSSGSGHRWVDQPAKYYGHEYMIQAEEVGLGYQYLTSFHWALAQLAGGSVEIVCSNSGERVFNICTLIVGLIGVSALISMLSASMVELQNKHHDRKDKLRLLRRYLFDNNIEPGLSVRVSRQCSERIGGRRTLTQESVDALAVLSTSLHKELCFKVCQNDLLTHPLFYLFAKIDLPWLERVCFHCIKSVILRIEDDLFTSGSKANDAYIVVSGGLDYSQDPDFANVELPTTWTVTPQTWLCESVLWCHWSHVGTAEATQPSKVLVIDAQMFADMVQDSHPIAIIASEYCIQYHKRVASACPPYAPWPNDLEVPFTNFGDLVWAMDGEVARTISLAALENLRHQGLFSLSKHTSTSSMTEKALEDEVNEGRSTVVQDSSGKAVRIVSVVAVKVMRHEKVLAQLGKFDADQHPVANCELPGGKRERTEMIEEAMQRIILTKLGPVKDVVEVEGMRLEIIEKTSRKHDVHTRYLRTVCDARFTADQHFHWQHISLRDCGLTNESWCSEGSGQFQDTLSSISSQSAGWTNRRVNLDRYMDAEVYVVRHGDKGTFYAWLTNDEFRHFETVVGQKQLGRWLGGLKLPAEELPPFGTIGTVVAM